MSCFVRRGRPRGYLKRFKRRMKRYLIVAFGLMLGGCMVGPDYHQPDLQMPMTFKEGAQWQRAAANPQGALQSQWWLMYNDATLNDLIERSSRANQSIIAAEAAYRLAQAQVASSRAGLADPGRGVVGRAQRWGQLNRHQRGSYRFECFRWRCQSERQRNPERQLGAGSVGRCAPRHRVQYRHRPGLRCLAGGRTAVNQRQCRE